MFSNPFQIEVLREGIPYEQVTTLRRLWTYDNVYDPRYLQGGLHQALTAEQLEIGQQADASSFYLVAQSNSKDLAAYARISAKPTEKDTWKVHVLCCHPDLRGEKLRWLFSGDSFHGKAGRALYWAISHCASGYGIARLTADICILPVPCVPSLSLHVNLGFVPSGKTTNLKSAGGKATLLEFVKLL